MKREGPGGWESRSTTQLIRSALKAAGGAGVCSYRVPLHIVLEHQCVLLGYQGCRHSGVYRVTCCCLLSTTQRLGSASQRQNSTAGTQEHNGRSVLVSMLVILW